MRDLATVKKEIKELEHKLKAVKTEEKRILTGQRVICQGCKKKFPLRKWIFLQQQSYVVPYSCTGGDYWTCNKQEVCYLMCPECGEYTSNFIRLHPQAEQLKLLDLSLMCGQVKYKRNHYGDLRGWREEAEISDERR